MTKARRDLLARVPVQLPTRRAPTNVAEYRLAAKRRLPKVIWDYVDGGAEDEQTVAQNRAVFGRWALRPKILVDVSKTDLGVTVCGQDVALSDPRRADRALGAHAPRGRLGPRARGRGQRHPRHHQHRVELFDRGSARATTEPPWFQLYPWGDRDFTATFIDRATTRRLLGDGRHRRRADPRQPRARRPQRHGGPAEVPHEADRRRRHAPAGGWISRATGAPCSRNLAAPGDGTVQSVSRHNRLINPALDWDELRWMRDVWSGPLLVKGVLDPADAARCVEAGADGVVVSNHGGRQLDGAVASLDAAPADRRRDRRPGHGPRRRRGPARSSTS